MGETDDREPASAGPERRPESPAHHGAVAGLVGGWRMLLPAAILAAALGAAMASAPGPTATESMRPSPEPTAVAAVPLASPTGPVATVAPSVGPTAQAPTATRVPPTPMPTATPSPVRPLAAPTMVPVGAARAAPARKPGTPDPDPSTDHFIVVDGDSGAVLFERNGYEPIAPASLTKIMTAILGLEHGSLSERVQVDVDARTLTDSTVMGLEPWFDVTLEDLLYGLMLPSGNDAALAIARYVAGSDEAFVGLMNEKAAWLGLRCTHFANPHGLDEPDHYSCPADMAAMARYGMQYPEFRKLAAARAYDIRESNIAYTIENLNPILWAYSGADGVKIGYTDNAGRSMVATAVRNGHRVYVAFMKSKAGLVPDTTLLLDWAYDSFVWP